MSLQVWLPLNGNTKNLGAACFQPIASDMVYSSFGVLGGQSYYSGLLTMPAEHTKKILNNQEISFSFWLKPYSTINSIIFGNEMDEGGGRQFSLFQYSGKGENYHGLALHWSWTFNFESGPNYDQNGNFIDNSKDSVIEDAFTIGKWTHVCVVYKNPELKIYLDGQLRAVRVAEMQYPSFDYDTKLLRTSGDKDISDFRLYNHALSSAEVKELSKGLILHYTFNDPLLENTTNLDVCKNSMQTKTLDINNSVGASIDFVNFKNNNCFKITINPIAATNSWRGLYMFEKPMECGAVKGDVVTRSCWMYIPEGQILPNVFKELIEAGASDISYVQYDYNTPNTWQRVSMTGTINTDDVNNCKFIHYFLSLGENVAITNSFVFYVKDFQTEINDHPTFYTSNARNYKCIDESGNGYDATQIDMSYTTQSNCGPIAADFNGTTSGLEIPFIKPDLFTGDCTLNFWVCPREESKGTYLGDFQLTNGSKYSIERRATTGYFRFWYNGGENGKDIDVPELTAPINQWTMLTLVHKASSPLQLTLYKNGNIENKTTITLPEALSEKVLGSKLRIGRDDRSNDDAPFKGQMSDFRIYATSLSDNDIQELYQTKAYITNFGDIETGQFVENKTELLITKKYTIENNEMCEEISSDFEQLEYVQASGGSTGPYINTGVILNNNSKVVIEFENEGDTLANLFGGRKNTTDSVFGMWIEPEAVHPHYGVDNVYNKHSLDISTLDRKLTYTLNKNVGSCDAVSSLSPVATFDCGYSLHLLTMYDNTGIDDRKAKGKLYRCQICNNGVLVRDYIPARRKSDKKIGLYDTINNVFYINNGSGTDFTAGPVLTNSVGSFYINNRISGRNLIEI